MVFKSYLGSGAEIDALNPEAPFLHNPFLTTLARHSLAFYPTCTTPTAVQMERIHLATDDLRHDGAAYSSQSGSPVQKRNRIQLSCASCRHGKLKCDRQQPCSQCVRKGRASQCTFSMPVRKPVVTLQNRLKHLERLVKDAMTAQSPTAQAALLISPDTSNGNISAPIIHGQDQTKGQQTPTSGQVLLNNGQTYVGATHWAAILEDVRTPSLPTFVY